MTTIIFDRRNRSLYADGKLTLGGSHIRSTSIQKVVPIGNLLVGVCGSARYVSMLWELSATKTGYTISTFPKRFRELLKEEGLLEDYNGNLLVLPQRDEPFFVGPDFTVLPIDKEPFYAIGSGEDYAFGAMAMAAPNWNIVAVYDVVAHYDTGTGGTIKRYSWDEDGAVEVVGVAYV